MRYGVVVTGAVLRYALCVMVAAGAALVVRRHESDHRYMWHGVLRYALWQSQRGRVMCVMRYGVAASMRYALCVMVSWSLVALCVMTLSTPRITPRYALWSHL